MSDAPRFVKQTVGSPRTTPRIHVGWFVALTVFCLVLVAYKIVSTRRIEVPLPELAGQLTVDALFITIGFIATGKVLGWMFVGRRGRVPTRSPKLIGFLAIFASLFAGAIMGPRLGNRQQLAMTTMAEREFARFERESVDAEGFPVRTAGPAPTAAQVPREIVTPEQLLRDVFARGEAARNEYLAEFEAIGWDSILDPARIERDTTLTEGRKMVHQAKTNIARHEARMQKFFADTREQIRALPQSDEAKRGMLKGFDDSFAGSNLEELQTLERQVVEHISDMIEVLAKSKHGVGWRIEDDDIRFLNDDDMNQYNSHFDSLMQTTAKQEKLAAENRERLKKRLAD